MKLALVFSENQFSEQLTLPATIVWCTPFGGGFQVGFKFGPMSPEVQGYLTLFIQFLEGDDDGADDRAGQTKRTATMNKPDDLRPRHPRYEVRLSAELRVGATLVTGVTRNLSVGGVSSRSTAPWPKARGST